MHSLQAAPNSTIDSQPIPSDVMNGNTAPSARKPVVPRSRSRRCNRMSRPRYSSQANTEKPPSEIGMPPHTVDLRIDEYGLIIVTAQPELPVRSALVTPGMNEQWIPWTCRSRCWMKS